MKKWIVILLAVSLFSCQQRKKEIVRLNAVQDSLTTVAMARDSVIMSFLSDFNDIQENLDSIKAIEKLVTVQKNQGTEMKASQKEKIKEDLKLLAELLQRNKQLTASLQKKLDNANFRIGKLEGMVTEFERMVANLNNQVVEKDAEIVVLNNDLKKLQLNLESVSQELVTVSKESQQKTQTIETQTVELNKAYFAMGTVKELDENGVLDKSGGVLGMGRTLKLKKDFNRDYFTEIDIRNLKYLPLNVKKAKIVSVHPASSYHITGQKRADTLFVDNYQEFWKASKYLVIALD